MKNTFKYKVGDVVFVKDSSFNLNHIGTKEYAIGRIEKAMIRIKGSMYTFWDWERLINKHKKFPKINGEEVEYEIQQVYGYGDYLDVKCAWYNEDEILAKVNKESIFLTEDMFNKLGLKYEQK
jgi:hypothetical protein